MSIRGNPICGICLKVAESELEEANEVLRQIFDILLLKVDLDITRHPIICRDCVALAKKCLNFKFTCMNTEKNILLVSNDRKYTKHDIIKIIQGKDGETVNGGLGICRFCMMEMEGNTLRTSLDALVKDTEFEMLSIFMPEMDFNIIDNPIVCTSCKENLVDYFNFISNCLTIEEEIKAYHREEKTDRIGPFLFNDTSQYTEKCPQICAIKEELNTFKGREWVCPRMYGELIKLEKVDIKEEEIYSDKNSYIHPSDINFDKSSEMFPAKEFNEETKLDMISSITRKYINKCTYKKTVKANIIEDSLISDEDLLSRKHESPGMLKDKLADDSESNLIPSTLYGSMTKQQLGFKDNIEIYEKAVGLKEKNSVDSKMYKCSLCPFETKQNYTLTRHMLVHKDASEITMFKCPLCKYEAKQKSNVTKHMLVHKDASEIKMYKCSSCDFEAMQKNYLTKHMLVHKDISEIKMYKCSLCAFESKRRSNFISHMLVHKDVSETKMYKCSLCVYEGKRKHCFLKHMLVHKDVSEINMFKCTLCSYEANQKRYLNKHMIIHKDVSELKMFKCPSCPFETKRKNGLTQHELLVHKDVSEIKMYKCSSCDFKAKQKHYLTRHMLVHKDISEIKMYNCSSCAFQTKRRRCLTKHMIVHKDFSEMKM